MNDQNLRRNYDVYLGDDGIIYCEIEKLPRSEEKSTGQAQLQHQSVQKVLVESPKLSFPLLIDLLILSPKAKYTSEGARISLVALMAESQISRIAFVGQNEFLKKEVANLVKASGMKNKTRWFENKENAQAWLSLAVKKK